MAGSMVTPSVAPLTTAQCADLAWSPDSCDGHRMCTKCLQQKGCMIAEDGDCVSHGNDDYVDKYTNYTLAFEQGLVLPDARLNASARLSERQFWQFKAGDVTYCSANDMPCQRCIAQHFYSELPVSGADSRFCEGEGGCVCIFNCEFRCGTRPPPFEEIHSVTSIPTTRPPREKSPSVATEWPSTSSDSGDYSTATTFAIVAGPLLLFTCMIVRWAGQRPIRRAALEDPPADGPVISPRTSDTPPPLRRQLRVDPAPPLLRELRVDPSELRAAAQTTSAPTAAVAQANRPAQLELYGWISHRQNLIDTEQRRLNGYEDVIPWTRSQTPR